MEQISYVFEMTINDGQMEALKEKAAEYIQAVKDGEPGTLVYQWWLEEDGNRCVVHETFENSDAMLVHLANVGPSLPDLLALAPITRFEVFGEVSEQGRAALAELGVKHFAHLGGFSR